MTSVTEITDIDHLAGPCNFLDAATVNCRFGLLLLSRRKPLEAYVRVWSRAHQIASQKEGRRTDPLQAEGSYV